MIGGYIILVQRQLAKVIEWQTSGDMAEFDVDGDAIAIGPFDTMQAATDYAANAEQPSRVTIIPLLRPVEPGTEANT